MRALLAGVLLAAAVLLTAAPPVRACSCAGGPGYDYGQFADVVFDGVVTDVRVLPTTTVVVDGIGVGTLPATRYVFDVRSVRKGEAPPRLSIVSSGGGCDTSFLRGASYRIFAYAHNGRLHTGQCSGNEFLGRRAELGSPDPNDSDITLGAVVGIGLMGIVLAAIVRRRRA